MKRFLLTLAVCGVAFDAHAVDTLRYALIAESPAVEASQLPQPVSLEAAYKPVRQTSRGRAPQLPQIESPETGMLRYMLAPQDLGIEATTPLPEENLLNWVPLSIEAFGYDIRETWEPKSWGMFSYSLAFSR